MARLEDYITRGLASARPAAASVAIGALYFSTDTGVTERSTGAAWQSFSGTAAAWGGITGTLSAQTDLVAAIAAVDPSTITQAEIEAKLTGVITSHSHTGAGGVWALVATQVAAGAAQYDFTGLSYSELRVLVVGITTAGSSEARLRVSTDNGSTFLSTNGDYLGVNGVGSLNSADGLQFYNNASSAARHGEILIEGTNLVAPKIARSNFFSVDGMLMRLIPGTAPINAVRVYALAGTLTAGTIYVFGR